MGEETVPSPDSGIFFLFADSCTGSDSGRWLVVEEEKALLTYKRLTVARSLHGTLTGHHPEASAHQHRDKDRRPLPATVLMTSKLT